MRTASVCVTVASMLMLCGCAAKQAAPESTGGGEKALVLPAIETKDWGPLYFATPKDSVATANELLGASDWKKLSRYYDLSLTKTDPAELESGRFFVEDSASPTEGPTAVSRYKRPFPPGSKFIDATPVGDAGELPCIWSMHTMLEIDAGGGMKQKMVGGVSLIQTKEGFRFLPPARVADATLVAPVTPKPPVAAAAPVPPVPPVPAPKPTPDAEWRSQGSDDVLFFRPALRDRAADIPRGGMKNVPALAEYIEKAKAAAAGHAGTTRPGMQPWEPRYVYEPSDEELLVSLAGDRLFRTLSIAPLGTIMEARKGWPEGVADSVEYRCVPIERVEVAGTGVRYIVGSPVVRSMKLKAG